MRLSSLAILLVPLASHAQLNGVDSLWHTFVSPPDDAKTKVWWFHGETATTREGITADLEAFRQAGVGGVVYYDQVHGQGSDALEAFSPQWWQMFVFAAQESKRLGLTFETHISNGYVAGGPWITPDLGMQMLVAADTVVEGGRHVRGLLPAIKTASAYAEDVALLAFPLPQSGWQSLPAISPDGYLTLQADTTHYLYFDMPTDGSPFTARSVSYRAGKRGKATTSATNVPGPPSDVFVGTGYVVLPDMGDLEASDDGVHYRRVCGLPPVYNAHGSWNRKTVSFPPVTARHFRVKLHHWWTDADRSKPLRIGDITLSSQARIMRWEEKAGLVAEYIDSTMNTPTFSTADCIRSGDIIICTPCDSLPPGRWVVMRFSHVPTGAKTKHGRKNLTGLECDKLSRRAAEVQWRSYIKVMSDTLARHGLRLGGVAMDSHEAGSQNWTKGFDRHFLTRRGYSLLPFLPAMAGYVVDTPELSDSVLADVRRTIADLVACEYYGALDSLCRLDGLPFTAQAIGNALCLVGDPIQAKGQVQKPQGEFWAIHPDGNYDIKESSSAAHLYAKAIASGEAFTDAKYGQPLSYLKRLADGAYSYGINEFVVCASAYQPAILPSELLNTGGGRHYCLNRHNTYWPLSQPFWLYQNRCSWLLRQGMSVNDLCVYIGENAPVKILTYRLPIIPFGYDFDAFSSDALFRRMKAEGKRVVLPDGMSYGAVAVPRRTELTDAARQRLKQMQAEGVPVWYEGTEPLDTFLLRNGLQPDVQPVDITTDALWFAHRRCREADVYFVCNHSDSTISGRFRFRQHRGKAQWWDAVNGQRHSLAADASADGTVAINLSPWQSGFVVWSDDDTHLPPYPNDSSTLNLNSPIQGPWTVTFPGCGEVVLDSLTDWSLHADMSIRHFSGQATYQSTFTHTPKDGERVLLRFTRLCDMARIDVNGHNAGTVWCSPWQADITPFVRQGSNSLRITVANSLVNRMIADAALPANQRAIHAVPEIVKADDTLLPSGIIGPVYVTTCIQQP